MVFSKQEMKTATVAWTAPLGNYEAFEVTWTPGGATAVEVAKDTLTYDITGLNAGTEYTVEVRTIIKTPVTKSTAASKKLYTSE